MPATVYQGVINVTDGLGAPWNIPGLYCDGTHATANVTNLNAMIQQLLTSTGPTNGQGGTLQFQSAGTYVFEGTITVKNDTGGTQQPYTIIFAGTGEGMLNAPILQQTTDADFFVVNNNPGGSEDLGGVVFQDLMLGYTEGASGQYAAVHVVGGSNSVNLLRVTFVNCPISAWFENSLGCTMVNCNTYSALNAGIGLQLGSFDNDPVTLQSAIETFVSGCQFYCNNLNSGVAVQIYGCEHLRMINTRITGYQQGIVIIAGEQETDTAANVRHLYFGNVSCYPYSTSATAGAAVVIQSGSSTAPVTEVWFAQCEFSPGTVDYTGAGIVIQPGTTGPINQIRFVDCYSCLWAGPGMNIMGGTNIEILGGYYSCNGTVTGAEPYSQSGIAITGAASGLRIIGAACNNSVYNLNATPPGFAPATQVYGVFVGYGASGVRIFGCDLTGYTLTGTAGVHITGSTTAPRMFLSNTATLRVTLLQLRSLLRSPTYR
jgi:hypothetical protein